MSDKFEVCKVYDLAETVSMTVTRSWYSNSYGDVEVVGPGPLSDRFREIHQDGRAPYLVFADTMRYRMDGESHPLDVSWNCEAVEIGEQPVKEVEAITAALLRGDIARRNACEYFGVDVQSVDAENERDKARLAAIRPPCVSPGWGAAAMQSYQTFVDSCIDQDASTWAEIADLWQPVGGDA